MCRTLLGVFHGRVSFQGIAFDGDEERSSLSLEQLLQDDADDCCARCKAELDGDRFCSCCGAVTLDPETWVDGSTKV